MRTVPVQSSNLREIGYDPDRREMRIVFRDGQAHDYVGVPPEAHSRLMAADSHGKHFHAHIKGRFAARKTGGPQPMPDEPPTEEPSSAMAPADLAAAIRRYTGGR